MEKLNAYEKHENLTIEERRMQLVYLLNDTSVETEDRLTYQKISELVDYAVNTVRTYGWKFAHLLEEAKKRFCSIVKKVIEGIVAKVPVVFGKGTKLCYLVKFYNKEGKLVFSKIGKTIRPIHKRINEELNEYFPYGVIGAVIESVIDCGNVPPEGAECVAKAHFIQKAPHAYVPNDRFRNYNIDVEEFNTCVKNYLAIA